MTITGINFDVVQRSRGNCAVKIMAYDTCSQMTKHDGALYDFSRKASELVHHETMLPAGAPTSLLDPEALANACELAEKRSDSQTGRLLLFTCPRECPEHLRIELARTIARPYVAQGMGVVFAYHNTKAADGEEQPHIHFFLTTRAVTPEGLAPKKSPEWDRQFREKVPATPDDQKPKAGTAERQRICDTANTFFARYDLQVRLDPRRLEQQGIDRPPEPSAPRDSWQAWKREGADLDTAPAPVARVLKHRNLRKELAGITVEQAKIGEEIAEYEWAISLAMARPKTASTKQKLEETMSGNSSQWMFQDRGLIGLSGNSRAEAERAYAAWKLRYPDAARKRNLESYIDFMQAPMRQMSIDENPYDVEGNLVEGSYDETRAIQHQIYPESGQQTDTLAHAEALAAGQYLHADIIKPHSYKYSIADGGHVATIQIGEGRIIDDGFALSAEGKLSPEIGNLMHQLATVRGWQDYETTDEPEFKALLNAKGASSVKAAPPPKKSAPSKPKLEETKMPGKPTNTKPTENQRKLTKRGTHPAEPWMEKEGGYDALSEPLRASAKASYQNWLADADSDEQKAKRKEFGLHQYTDYVQQKFAERRAAEERAEATNAAAPDAQAPSEAKKTIKAARETEESKREFASFVHKLLSERYTVPEGLHDFVKRLDVNKESGEATLTLKNGGKLIDTGSEIRSDTEVNADLAAATVATAHARGWSTGGLTVTGSDDYRIAIAKAAALHVPPISTDVELPQNIREEIQTALVARAKAALKDAGNSVSPATNSVSPAAGQPHLSAAQVQAMAKLDRQTAVEQAELAGEPRGLTDHAAIVGPRIADVDAAIKTARLAAQEARQAVDDHGKEFPRVRRLLDQGARNRHEALKKEAARLEKAADKLESNRDATVNRINKEGRKEAKSAQDAHNSWRYQPVVRRAQKNLEDIDRMRKAIASGDPQILADINAGKLNEAVGKLSTFEHSQVQKARAARTPEQVRGQALDTVMEEIQRSERKPDRKAAAEEAMRAAVNGDSATIQALDSGKMEEALRAAAAWRQTLDEEAAKIRKAKEEKEALERRMAPQQVTIAQP